MSVSAFVVDTKTKKPAIEGKATESWVVFDEAPLCGDLFDYGGYRWAVIGRLHQSAWEMPNDNDLALVLIVDKRAGSPPLNAMGRSLQ